MRRLVAVVLGVAFLASVAVGADASRPAADSQSAIVIAHVDWLVNFFPRDPGKGAERYGGRTLQIEGWVDEFGRDPRGWYLALRRLSAGPTHVRCYLPPGEPTPLESVYKGKTVWLQGTCVGYDQDQNAVVLEECRMVIPDYHHDEEP